MKDDEATWLETISVIALLIAATLVTVFGTYVLWRATLADAAQIPVNVSAQDVSLKVKGGDDYTCYQGHAANQYERDMMEQTLLNVYMPKVVRYLRSMKSCASYVHSAESNLLTIAQRLNVVHQYDDISGPPAKTWQVTQSGRHYQIEYYRMQQAQSCSLGSGATACATNPEMTADLLDLLDLQIVNGACAKGAPFTPPSACTADSTVAMIGLADGHKDFGELSDADNALLETAVEAHAGGLCGATGTGLSVKDAQNAFIATASSVSEAHFRTPQPFTGGCDPTWSEDECCRWKELEHREYQNWATAVRTGAWSRARCAGRFHADMHRCANLNDPIVTIRPYDCPEPPVYPDLTDPMTCADYLASQYPAE